MSVVIQQHLAQRIRALAPWLQQHSVPCSNVNLASEGGRFALAATMASGEAALIVLCDVFDSGQPTHAALPQDRISADRVLRAREKQRDVVTSSSSVVTVDTAVRLQMWTTAVRMLEALLGVTVPQHDREMLIVGDLESAVLFLERLKRLARVPAGASIAPPISAPRSPPPQKTAQPVAVDVQTVAQTTTNHEAPAADPTSHAMVETWLKRHTGMLEARLSRLEQENTALISSLSKSGPGIGGVGEPSQVESLLPSQIAAGARTSIPMKNTVTSPGASPPPPRAQRHQRTVAPSNPRKLPPLQTATTATVVVKREDGAKRQTREWTKADDDMLQTVAIDGAIRVPIGAKHSRKTNAVNGHGSADAPAPRQPTGSVVLAFDTHADINEAVRQRLALRKKEDARRVEVARDAASFETKHTSHNATLEGAANVVARYLFTRQTALHVHAVLDRRHHAARLIQNIVRYWIRLRRHRKRFGRAEQRDMAEAATCIRCSHVAAMLRRRVTAQPLLNDGEASRYYVLACSPVCRAAMTELVM